jgi:hypothetical protein
MMKLPVEFSTDITPLVYIFGWLFNDVSIMPNEMMRGQLKWIWKVGGRNLNEVRSWHLLGGNEKHHEESQDS